jgi:hypothetical protein
MAYGRLIHVDPDAVDVESCLWVEEALELSGPESGFGDQHNLIANVICTDLLLRLGVEPIRVDRHTWPNNTKKVRAIWLLQPYVHLGTAGICRVRVFGQVGYCRVYHLDCVVVSKANYEAQGRDVLNRCWLSCK